MPFPEEFREYKASRDLHGARNLPLAAKCFRFTHTYLFVMVYGGVVCCEGLHVSRAIVQGLFSLLGRCLYCEHCHIAPCSDISALFLWSWAQGWLPFSLKGLESLCITVVRCYGSWLKVHKVGCSRSSNNGRISFGLTRFDICRPNVVFLISF